MKKPKQCIHFFVLAIAGLIVKVKRGLFDITTKECFSAEGEKKLQADNIQGHFLNKEMDDYETILFGFLIVFWKILLIFSKTIKITSVLKQTSQRLQSIIPN